MSNTNRDYLIVCEVKNSKITLARPLNFYITDKNTSNIFIKLVNRIENDNGISSYVDIENSTAYNVTLRIVKPNNETMSVAATQLEAEAIYQVDLEENCKNIVGTYKCELLITTIINEREELNTSDPFTYLVKKSILSDVGQVIETGGITTEKVLSEIDAIKANYATNVSVDEKIANASLGGGGLTSTATNLLISILRSAVFTTNQSANITALEAALDSGGSGGGSETTQYVINNNLSNATTNNNTALVDANASYTATITVNNGYTLDAITVTMGGTDITSSAVSGTTITIASVTGNVNITVTTTQQPSSGGTGSIINATWRNGTIDTVTGQVSDSTSALTDFIDVTQINTLKVSTVNDGWCSVNFYVYTSNSYDTYVDSTPHQGSDLYIQANSDTRKDYTTIDVSSYNYIIIKLSASTADGITIEVID